MQRDYIPRPDHQLDTWMLNLATFLSDSFTKVGLNGDDYQAIKDAYIAYRDALEAHTAAQAAAESARVEKDRARAALIAAVRPRIRIAQAFPGTTDADRAAMGIRILGSPPAPQTFARSHPVPRIDAALRLRHTLRLTDAAQPTRTARPHGAIGAEVRLALIPPGAPAPDDANAFHFLALATDGRATAEFTLADAGKTACYILRWTGAGGAVGPWSETHMATVAA